MNLATRYLGMDLDNPLVPSASPLSRDLGTIRALEDAGAAAVVLFSLFEEEIDANEEAMELFTSLGAESFAEALDYFPKSGPYTRGGDDYLDHLRKVKEAVEIPVIASLNGMTPGGWVRYAALMEEAGADALELNVYFMSTDPTVSAAEVEERYLEIVRRVRAQVRIPLSVKLSPWFSSLPHMAARLVEAGADGLVLFNRFYQPDIDLEALEVTPALSLSSSLEARLAMRWIAVLRSQLATSLAATSGVHTPEDALKLLMAGADVTMLCSTLLAQGPRRLAEIRAGLVHWATEHGYESVAQMKGSMSYASCPIPGLYERANYMKVLQSWRPR